MTCSGAQLDSGTSVLNCSITRDKGPPYAFLKMRSVQEASNALAFNGIQFRGHTLKVCAQAWGPWVQGMVCNRWLCPSSYVVYAGCCGGAVA